jgi:hypothetical protein
VSRLRRGRGETGAATRPGRSFTRPAENISIPLAREALAHYFTGQYSLAREVLAHYFTGQFSEEFPARRMKRRARRTRSPEPGLKPET